MRWHSWSKRRRPTCANWRMRFSGHGPGGCRFPRTALSDTFATCLLGPKREVGGSVTGQEGDPQEQIMQRVEKVLLASNEKSEDFRRSLISQIGAFRV